MIHTVYVIIIFFFFFLRKDIACMIHFRNMKPRIDKEIRRL